MTPNLKNARHRLRLVKDMVGNVTVKIATCLRTAGHKVEFVPKDDGYGGIYGVDELHLAIHVRVLGRSWEKERLSVSVGDYGDSKRIFPETKTGEPNYAGIVKAVESIIAVRRSKAAQTEENNKAKTVYNDAMERILDGLQLPSDVHIEITSRGVHVNLPILSIEMTEKVLRALCEKD